MAGLGKNYKQLRESLLRRTEQSHNTRDSYGGFKSIFKDGLDVTFWDCKEGTHLIDILPYQAGENDPYNKPGDYTYVLDVWVHFGVGPNDDSYICLAKTYGKPCPICEYKRELQKQGNVDEDEIKSLNPKRRVVYAIICYDSDKEEDKGVQVWEVAHFFMERHLSELAKNPRTGGFILFADPTSEGKSIQFSKRGRGAGNVEFIGHKFVDRDYDIPDEILEQVPCLDELIHVPSYEEVYEAFHCKKPDQPFDSDDEREVEEVEEEVKTTKRSRKARKVEEPEPEPENMEEEVSEEEPEDQTCPGGGVFGRDIDELSHCNECKLYDECYEEFERLEEERKRQRQARASRRRRK